MSNLLGRITVRALNTRCMGLPLAAVAFFFGLLLPPSAEADPQGDAVWTDGTGSQMWSDASNWKPELIPVETTRVQIGAQPTGGQIGLDTGDAVTVASFTFNNTLTSSVDIAPLDNETLQVNGDIVNNSACTCSFSAPVIAGASASWSGPLAFSSTVNVGNKTITLANGLTFTGYCTLQFDITSATTYGHFQGSGTADVGGATILIGGTYTGVAGDTFDFTSGSFSGAVLNASYLPVLSSGLSWNTNNFIASGILSVVSAASPPAITAQPVSGLTAGGATLNAAINPNGNTVDAFFQYSTTANFSGGTIVSTLAGSAGNPAYADGIGAAARFDYPYSVAVDASGAVYVADFSNHCIRKVTPAGVVTTLAGAAGNPGYADGTGTNAQFNCPRSVAVDASGTVYVAETGNNCIRKVTAAGVVSTLAGSAGNPGYADGTNTVAQFNSPQGMAVDVNGNVYVADNGNNCIRMVTPAGVVSTLVGSTTCGFADGTGVAAQFNGPTGVALDASGTIYVSDCNNCCIRRVTPAGVVTTLAGLAENSGYADGTGTAARFRYPSNVALDANGTVYVADQGNNHIRMVTPAGVVTTLASAAVQFNGSTGVAVDGSGTVYVADSGNSRIILIASSTVSILAQSGLTGTDSVNVSLNVTKLLPETTYYFRAGATNNAGQIYGEILSFTTLNNPTPITPSVTTWPTASAIFYGQTLASSILSGGAASVAGTFAWTTPATVPGVGTGPQAVTFTPSDTNAYTTVSSTVNATVYVPLAITAQPVSAVVSVGQPASLSASHNGTGPFGYQWLKDGAILPGQTNATLTYASFQFISSGSYSVVITNAAGMAITLPASLSVPDAPLKAWGSNRVGQLGLGNDNYASVRLPETVASNVVATAVGSSHSLFVTTDGTLWSMGENYAGQLGDGSNDESRLPVAVASNVVTMAAGAGHSLFVMNDGTLWAMGFNLNGQLGNGTTANTNRPVFVASNVVAVAAGDCYSLFIKADGTLWGMGYNEYGQLGNDTLNESNPTPLYVTSNVVAVAAGSFHSLFIKTDGTLWGMGYNEYGQLGSEALAPVNPTPLYVTNNVVAVAGGSQHSLFIKADGTLWGMGSNDHGELGNDTLNSANPTPLYVTDNVVAVTGGDAFSVFIKADGRLWAVGWNIDLVFGNVYNGVSDHFSPVPVRVNEGVMMAATLANRGGAAADHVLAIAGTRPVVDALMSQVVTFGQSITFATPLSGGDGPFTYQWQRSGTNLVGATAATYTLDNVALTDAGSYAVVVASFYGSTNSSSATLKVKKATPTVTTWPTASAITYGQTLSASILSSGSASVAGTFAWTTPDALPEVGTARQEVTFTPTDTNDYNAVSSTIPGAGLILRYTGSFGPTTTLGGDALGAETPFVIVASFDSAQNLSPVPLGYGLGLYAATATITLDGFGTYQSAPGADLAVWLINPTDNFAPFYAAGIGNSSANSGAFSTFEGTTPQFFAETPGPTVFSGVLGNIEDSLPFSLPLGDGTSSLVINDFGSATPTAEITAGQALEVGPEVTVNAAKWTTTHPTPEAWLEMYGFTSDFDQRSLDDTDRDGLANWQEYVAGTDPTNTASRLVCTAIDSALGTNYTETVVFYPAAIVVVHGVTNSWDDHWETQRVHEVVGYSVTWPSVTGRLYSVEYSTNLLNWLDLEGAKDLQGISPVNTFTDLLPSKVKFYRVKVRLPSDS